MQLQAAEFEDELLQELMADEHNSKSATGELYYNVYQDSSGKAKGMKESLSHVSSEL